MANPKGNPQFGTTIKGGRPKGVPNKLTTDLKTALLEPFDPVRFRAWAKKREDAYYTAVVTKLLPKDLNIRAITSLDDLTDVEKKRLLEDLRRRLEPQIEHNLP